MPFFRWMLASPKYGSDRVIYRSFLFCGGSGVCAGSGSGGRVGVGGIPGGLVGSCCTSKGVSCSMLPWVWGRSFAMDSECLALNSLTDFSKRSRGNLFFIKMDLRYAISSKNGPILEQILSALNKRHCMSPVLYLLWVKELCFMRRPVYVFLRKVWVRISLVSGTLFTLISRKLIPLFSSLSTVNLML